MLSSPGDINVKNIAFTPYCGVGVVGGGGGGGGGGREIHPNIYHDPAIGYSIS